ncbi:MAG: TetR/AcrR family transcriptional regulator [Opitutaceae bacterium]
MKAPVRPPPARQRLLEAAARVFARDGLTGATTRAIAREAGVNEVTLFRIFQTKDRLLAAVVGTNFGPEAAQTQLPALPVTADLRADLLAHAQRYERQLQVNLPLIRAMIGEIHHHSDHERQVFKAILRPLREALIARLETAHLARALHSTMNPELQADLFNGMIFTGVLRRASAHVKPGYSPGDYLTGVVDLLLKSAR